MTALVATLLVACGGGGGAGDASSPVSPPVTAPGPVLPAPPPPAAPAPAYTLAVDGAPLKATSTLDSGRAVTQDLPLSGGTLTTTGADGTVYELTVPANALALRTRIRMTPLASFSVDGLPSDAQWGVKLEPAGTQFLNPVSLRITPPAGVAMGVREQLAVGVDGASATVSLASLQPTAQDVRLQLMHFSSYALLFAQKGVNASLAAVRHRLGGTAEDRLQSAAAEWLAGERQRQATGRSDSAVDQAALDALRDQFVREVLLPRLNAAGSSCAAGKLAAQTLLGYTRQMALIGGGADTRLPKPESELLLDVLAAATPVCLREEYEICRDQHIVVRVLPAFLGARRQAEWLGAAAPSQGLMPPWLVQAEDHVRRCLQFELAFDSTLTASEVLPPQHAMAERVQGRVAVGYNLAFTQYGPEFGATLPQNMVDTGALITGAPAPLLGSGYNVSLTEDCTRFIRALPRDGQIAVTGMGYVTPDPFSNSPVIGDLGIGLAFVPNLSSFDYDQGRRDANGQCVEYSARNRIDSWGVRAGDLLEAAFNRGSTGLYVEGWQLVQNSDILGSRDFSLQGDGVRMTGSLVLFHKPR